MNYYWCSWIQKSEDYRPLNYPPNEQVLGWWCSGYDGKNNPIICAQIKAQDEENAKLVVQTDWPEMYEWRFINKENDLNLSDRFERKDWMVERVKQESQ